MRRPTLTILISLLFVSSICVAASSYGYYRPPDPIGPASVPPSISGKTLLRSPNPVDRSGNLLMTGNVRYGRYFRPGVPYSSPTSFHSNLGSTELDSFMRDSAGSESWSRNGSGRAGREYFYSGTGTVSTTSAGKAGVFRPSESRIEGRVTDVYGLDRVTGIESQSSTSGSDMASLGINTGSMTPQQMKLFMSPETSPQEQALSTDEKSYSSWRDKMTEQMTPLELEKVDDSLLDESQKDSKGTLDYADRGAKLQQKSTYPERDVESFLDPLKQSRQSEAAADAESKTARQGSGMDGIVAMEALSARDILNQMKQEQEVVVGREDTEQASGEESSVQGDGRDALTTSAKAQTNDRKRYYSIYGSERLQEVIDISSAELEDMEDEEASHYTFSQRQSVLDKVNSMSRVELAAEAKQIMGPHKDLRTYKDVRFREKFAEAAGYLRQGKYYQASDAFEMASVYMPGHPAADVGRALALFGAGEYVSSSLFLSRALASKPGYARTEIDLVVALGNRDKLEARVSDLERWLGRSEEGELEYLLAYIYFRTGRINKAEIAINTAAKRMPNKAAVNALKEAIAIAKAVGTQSQK